MAYLCIHLWLLNKLIAVPFLETLFSNGLFTVFFCQIHAFNVLANGATVERLWSSGISSRRGLPTPMPRPLWSMTTKNRQFQPDPIPKTAAFSHIFALVFFARSDNTIFLVWALGGGVLLWPRSIGPKEASANPHMSRVFSHFFVIFVEIHGGGIMRLHSTVDVCSLFYNLFFNLKLTPINNWYSPPIQGRVFDTKATPFDRTSIAKCKGHP